MNEQQLFQMYLMNVDAYIQKKKINRKYPNEGLMRQIEESIDIPEQSADDFRRSLMAFIGNLYLLNKPIRWDSNPHLAKAIKKTLKNDKDRLRVIAGAYLKSE